MATGTLNAVDRAHQAVLINRGFRTGSILGLDQDHQASVVGVIIGDTTTYGGADTTLVQGQQLSNQALTLTLWDGQIEGWTNVDGTFVDGSILSRYYDPAWIDYSIWYLTPPLGTPLVLQGYGHRQPGRVDVGKYYALMYAPDSPGRYQIQWRFQDDEEPWARQVNQEFFVSSLGISAQPDYTGGI